MNEEREKKERRKRGGRERERKRKEGENHNNASLTIEKCVRCHICTTFIDSKARHIPSSTAYRIDNSQIIARLSEFTLAARS